MDLSPDLSRRLKALLGSAPVAATPVYGGYSPARRLLFSLADGRKMFAKIGSNSNTSAWLRKEFRIYSYLASELEAEFVPKCIGWLDDEDEPCLLLEDLSGGSWKHEWNDANLNRVLNTLKRINNTTAPDGLSKLDDMRDKLSGWRAVKDNPEPFLSLGLCSVDWLDTALPRLLMAEKSANLKGDKLAHFDIRSDNICFYGDRTLIVDWNWACVGNAELDLIAWLPSVALEGGPPPDALAQDADANLVALMTGYWASVSGLTAPSPGSKVRDIQLAQLKVALPWCIKTLNLEECH